MLRRRTRHRGLARAALVATATPEARTPFRASQDGFDLKECDGTLCNSSRVASLIIPVVLLFGLALAFLILNVKRIQASRIEQGKEDLAFAEADTKGLDFDSSAIMVPDTDPRTLKMRHLVQDYVPNNAHLSVHSISLIRSNYPCMFQHAPLLMERQASFDLSDGYDSSESLLNHSFDHSDDLNYSPPRPYSYYSPRSTSASSPPRFSGSHSTNEDCSDSPWPIAPPQSAYMALSSWTSDPERVDRPMSAFASPRHASPRLQSMSRAPSGSSEGAQSGYLVPLASDARFRVSLHD